MDPFSASALRGGIFPEAAMLGQFQLHSGSDEGFPCQSEDLYEVQEVVEVSSSSWVSSKQQKRKRGKVAPHDVIEIDAVDQPSEVVIIGQSTCDKNKQPMEYDEDFQKHIKNSLLDLIGSSTKHGSENDFPLDVVDDDVYEEEYLDDDYGYDYSEYEENGIDLDVQFDGLDLPSGIEAPVPWLQMLEPEKSSMKPVIDDVSLEIYKQFKQFDTVQDFSDHYYNQGKSVKGASVAYKPSKHWTKRIQHEWKVLENDLPDAIFVRVNEERMDLLRAVIIGPAGTPYHDGLFFFDVLFPSTYPNTPPLVHYHSGGLRLNPNLYAGGKVCLSLLGTWVGKDCEKWNPVNSTMLQVLVSIQALVLNAKPYFNEPGYEESAGSVLGEKRSLTYNENIFLLSCKTMMYSLRKPPQHFEHFVAGYFRERGRAILVACRAYMNGAQVGCVDAEGIQDVDEGDTSSSTPFRFSLKTIYEDLLMEFTVKGADCDEFLAQKTKALTANVLDTTLRL